MKDLVRIIFEVLDAEWLQIMWDSDEEMLCEMIDIIYLIFVIKTQS